MTALVERARRALFPTLEADRLALPFRHLGWVTLAAGASLSLGYAGWWVDRPDICVAILMAAAVIGAAPGKWWTGPLVALGSVLASLAVDRLGGPPILAVGAMAGLAVTLLLPQEKDAWDVVHGVLGAAIGGTLGLWGATNWAAAPWVGPVEAMILAVWVAVPSGLGLWLAVLRPGRSRPPGRHLLRGLQPAFRPPVERALGLWRRAQALTRDHRVRMGLAEVATWVARLQHLAQRDAEALESLPIADLQARIRACEASDGPDPFTHERQGATAEHLRRVLEVRQSLEVEQRRTAALVDHALAFLEEATAGLALSRHGSLDPLPDRLPDVLEDLRRDTRASLHRRDARLEVERARGPVSAGRGAPADPGRSSTHPETPPPSRTESASADPGARP